MADEEIFRPRRRVTADEVGAESNADNPLESVQNVQRAIAGEMGRDDSPMSREEAPFQIQGNIPPAFRKAMEGKKAAPTQGANDDFVPPIMNRPSKPVAPKASPDSRLRLQGSDALEAALKQLAEKHTWEEFEFLSGGKFYTDIPQVIHIRAMTGEEEQILSTPRLVKRGKAIDMIFQRCVQEKFPTEQLLSLDRTHLLIYLRGISYTPEYDVEIRCPHCDTPFATIINLNSLDVVPCPSDFDGQSLQGELPTSGFRYKYRLAAGADEQEINAYRDRKIQMFGDQSEDDTLLYRTALLLDWIEGVTDKKELTMLLKRLPINDVSHLRNKINEPPFGVDTEVPMDCPNCGRDFKIDLPFEANFFFPRPKKEEKNQA